MPSCARLAENKAAERRLAKGLNSQYCKSGRAQTSGNRALFAQTPVLLIRLALVKAALTFPILILDRSGKNKNYIILFLTLKAKSYTFYIARCN